MSYFTSKDETSACGELEIQEKLLRATVNKRETVDQEKTFSALLNNLSKALDCLSHDLIIANLMLMDLVYQPQGWLRVTYPIESNELK